MKKYDHRRIEKKWQRYWQESNLYLTRDFVRGKKNYLLLTEFPYPSGNLHIGHWFAFAVPDILARYLRMNGYNVMYPIGFDAFGLPAENAAIKRGINPRRWTQKNIAYMTRQLKSMGATFDWSRAISTIDPEYYKWTQWIFVKMFEKGLAYRKETLVNWCPKDKTVLANEQVINGCCERCDTPVEQNRFEQWLFKITDYADRLVDDIQGLDWPQSTKLAQKNWIGRSDGVVVKFEIVNEKLKKQDKKQDKINGLNFEVFTTRLDTIFGCTYCVLAPEHPLIADLKEYITNRKEIEDYVKKSSLKTELERQETQKEKTGVELKGVRAVNPFNGWKIPIFVADYVLFSYGTGAVMAVPAHDERDFEFAKKYNLKLVQVVTPKNQSNINASNIFPHKNPKAAEEEYLEQSSRRWQSEQIELLKRGEKCFVGEGILVNSGDYSGMESQAARAKMADWLESVKLGRRTRTFRLRDWVVSRQRYWGVPIPMINCSNCGWVTVPEKDLPLLLPKVKDYLPTGDGKSPLAKNSKWIKTHCPKCQGPASRESDTMDTFVDSSWYFIRYTDPKNKKKLADLRKIKKWLPVPLYIGGAEHNTMHLLYSRFLTKVLADLKCIDFTEPFTGRRNHGTILGPDNQKMSKSRGNVIDPDAEVERFGADSVRTYLAFMGPYDQDCPWQKTGIVGVRRFLERVWRISQKKNLGAKTDDPDLTRLLHQTIKKVGENIAELRFNTAVAALMILANEMEKRDNITKDVFEKLLLVLAPFAPHISEELWTRLGHKKSIFLNSWPNFDEKLAKEDRIRLIVQVNGKLRDQIEVEAGISEQEAKEVALESERVKKFIQNKKIKRIIFARGRLLNIVV